MSFRRSARRVRRTLMGGGATLDASLPDGLALIAETVTRVTGARPLDVDLDAGASLCSGLALDDRLVTDQTLVLAIPALLHALDAGGVHVIAATGQAAGRHAAWLKPVAEQLGLRVTLLEDADDLAARARRYEAEIVCGTANDVAYDVLRNWLAWDTDGQVDCGQRVAVVDQIDNVLLDQGQTMVFITAPSPVRHGWYQWAETIAPQLERGRHVYISAGGVVLTPLGVDYLRNRIDLQAVYDDHVAVFDLVTAAVQAHELWRRGRNYEISDREVVPMAGPFPRGVREAITVHEGLTLAEANVVLSATTVRRHMLGYGLVTGIGVLPTIAARQLRELYGLRVRAPKAEIPAGHDLVFDDDESRMRAVQAAISAAREEGRSILCAARYPGLAATMQGLAGEDKVLNPGDPIPDRRHSTLIALGRAPARHRDIRLARNVDNAYFYSTWAELMSMTEGNRSLLRKVRHLRNQPVGGPALATRVAELQEADELASFHHEEIFRVTADVRDAHHERLISGYQALITGDPLAEFRRFLDSHLEHLLSHHRRGKLTYPELLTKLTELYPCGLPPQAPSDLITAARADAQRAFAERADHLGAPGTEQLVPRVADAVAQRWWRGHIVDLDTLAMVCRTVHPQQRSAEFRSRATELFTAAWPKFAEETIGHVFHLQV